MGDFIVNIVMDSIISIITFLGGIIGAYIVNKLKVGKQKRSLKIVNLDGLRCYTANTGVYAVEDCVGLGYVFEYMSIGVLTEMLCRIYKNQGALECKMTKLDFREYRNSDKYRNMIVIGGPNHNVIAREMVFGCDKIPFKYEDDDSLIYCPEEGDTKKYSWTLHDDGVSRFFETDIALIINMINPSDKSKRIILISGCKCIGCLGGAVFVSKLLHKVKECRKYNEYALVVKCEGEEEHLIKDPELLDVYEINTCG